MSIRVQNDLTLAETGALALDEAARKLDHAADAAAFLEAVRQNQRVWQSIGHLAATRSWRVPNRGMVAYALKTTDEASGKGGRDDRIHALIDINRQVSAVLAGDGGLDALRQRAQRLWEERGRPFGAPLEQWLLLEIESSAA
ncbi:hypothetical protein A6A04_18335 [Paramagnetospirillum marisnigri]|uniref:Uncharacterized protein n=1 Tax=Paramagnetospirillum marisnigri TaxID=1285242 RepID=A0A178MP82_9PROT|nr:DUF2934 domain-containing protein [Paramagnetospirillum marisnigri]OAN50439.1 hypothetical protein A6A04_18335 [Paramagnetospirillum marisnigri]